jgi:hypothetical protein
VLTVHGRSHPDATDFWDGNWLDCTAEVTAGAFHGRLDRSLRAGELDRFRGQLARLHETLTGEAVLETMEHWLMIRVAGDGRGHLEASCRLCDGPALGNVLECRLSFDQTFLPTVVRQLETAMQTHPIVGR